MAALRCLNDFSAPSSANVMTGPKMSIRDGSFELERNAMTLDKKPSAAENFSMKFSRHVKNATPTATNSPVASVT
jgi:hypothetical protein